MDLFERVKLLVRSTLSGGLPVLASSSKGDPQKMLDTAEAKLEILRDDLARAEKKGNDELAGKLKVEIADLEKLIARARGKAQAANAAQTKAAQPAQHGEPAHAETQVRVETAREITVSSTEKTQVVEKPADVVIDESRVADQLKKLREGK